MSEQMGHTPGPWEVRKEHGEYRIHAADSFECGYRVEMRIVEDVGGYRHPQEDGSWSDAEIIANARLIAAAPDLLAALNSIVSSLAEEDEEGLIEHTEQMIAARRAIAMATANHIPLNAAKVGDDTFAFQSEDEWTEDDFRRAEPAPIVLARIFGEQDGEENHAG